MKPGLAALALCAALAGCSDGSPSSNPKTLLGTEMRGFESPPEITLGEADAVYWTKALLAGFRRTTDADFPAQVEPYAGSGSCRLPAPTAEQAFKHVLIDVSYMPGPVFSTPPGKLGERTEQYVRNLQNGHDVVPSSASDDRIGVADVIVTETSKPVYLLLTTASDMIFNLQLADGVKLAQVVVMAPQSAGVANLPEGAPLTIIAGSSLQSCGGTPLRRPRDHWNFVRNVKESPSLRKVLTENQSIASRYGTWFRKTFSQGSEETAIGPSEGSEVLVGPAPAPPNQRVKFRPLKGSKVILDATGDVFVGTGAAYEKFIGNQIRQKAAQFAGGDLANLKIKK